MKGADLCAVVGLVSHIVRDIVCQLSEESMQHLWLGERQLLQIAVVLAAATLHDVRGECEGSTSEA